jgi:hypothetical protein
MPASDRMRRLLQSFWRRYGTDGAESMEGFDESSARPAGGGVRPGQAGTSWLRNTVPVMAAQHQARWSELWNELTVLREHARRLRHLSHEEPLAQHNPGYPKAGLGRSHADEVREVLSGIQRGLEQIRQGLPSVLPEGTQFPGIAADEQPKETAARLEALSRLAETLAREAFQPLPPLPPHAPPYLFEPPGHDLAGTKAVLLAIGIERVTTSIRNLMLAAANSTS